MSAIRGRVTDGKIDLPAPADWPEGTVVVVRPLKDEIGITEEDWPKTPEAIAAWIGWLDSLQPFLTPEEEAEWRKALAEQKAFELSKWEEHTEKLRKVWE